MTSHYQIGVQSIGADYQGGFFTPGTVLDEMNTLKSQIGILSIDVRASSVPIGFKVTYEKFRKEYETFYENNTGWFDRTKNVTYALVLEYKDRLAQFRSAFKRKGGATDIKLARPPPARAFPWVAVGATTSLAILAMIIIKR